MLCSLSLSPLVFSLPFFHLGLSSYTHQSLCLLALCFSARPHEVFDVIPIVDAAKHSKLLDVSASISKPNREKEMERRGGGGVAGRKKTKIIHVRDNLFF